MSNDRVPEIDFDQMTLTKWPQIVRHKTVYYLKMLFATHVDTDDKTTTLIQGTGSNANNMQYLYDRGNW